MENMHIPKEKFAFVPPERRISQQIDHHKHRGYFQDAWLRFRRNKASVVAAVIILAIVLYAFLTPLLITTRDATTMCSTYARKPARVTALRKLGIATGGVQNMKPEAALVMLNGIAVGAESQGEEILRFAQVKDSPYHPVLKLDQPVAQARPNGSVATYYPTTTDTYLEVGFTYVIVDQPEYRRMLSWQEETGLQLIYPHIDTQNGFCFMPANANMWYKTQGKGIPVSVDEGGTVTTLSYGEDLVLEDNYLRDGQGNLVYVQYTDSADVETAQVRLRVLYYNYYRYRYGSEPNYLFGTDAQGYDLALRIAGGIRLSLLVAVCVSAINFLIGAAYGAVSGYYGGTTDLVLSRITDILNGLPFVVVATLFQIHLSRRVGAIPSLLFAYVLTGWIGTANRVRTQFYRYKNQEYVMAARTLGARDRRIIWKHIFPNTLGTLITASALVIPRVILTESMLSFLGILKLGSARQTSLGTLLSNAGRNWTSAPHLLLYPALVISLLMICFNLFGNGLRDAFNPALRGVED